MGDSHNATTKALARGSGDGYMYMAGARVRGAWSVSALWEVPGGPDRPQPQPTGPAGPPGHILRICCPERPPRRPYDARFGRHSRPTTAGGVPRAPTYRHFISNPRTPATTGRPGSPSGSCPVVWGAWGGPGPALGRCIGLFRFNPPDPTFLSCLPSGFVPKSSPPHGRR